MIRRPAAGAAEDLTRDLDLRLLVPALAAWAVSAGTLALHPAVLVGLAAACLVMAALVLRWARVSLPLAAIALVLASTAGHSAAREAGPVRGLAREHAMVELTGVVTKDPVVVGGRRLDGATVRLVLRVDEVSGRGRRSRVATPVLVIGRRQLAASALARADRGQGHPARVRAGRRRRRGAAAPW